MSKSPQLISLNQACAMTSLSRTAINLRRTKGTFPQALSMEGRRIAFVRDEVEKWIKERIAARKPRPAATIAEGDTTTAAA